MGFSKDLSCPVRARGYTAVEVMLSIVVLGVGAAGVMSMQKAALQGNNDAHMMDVGNAIAREWIERLRRDGVTWTLPDKNSAQNWSTATALISQIGANTSAGTWIWPSTPGSGANAGAADPGYGRSFDILGRDLPVSGSTQPPPVFCTNIRGDWLVQDELIRAQVRVYWLRQMFAAPPSGGAFCSATDTPDATGTGGGTQIYHFIYASTAISRNPAQ